MVPVTTIFPHCDTTPIRDLAETHPMNEILGGTGPDDAPPLDNPAVSDPPNGQGEDVPVNGSSQPTSKVEMIIRMEFDDFSPEVEAALLPVIKQVTGLTGEIKVIYRRRGSVILTLELSKEDAERLCRAFREGALTDHQVVDCKRLPSSLESNPPLEGEVKGVPIVTCRRWREDLQSESRKTPGEPKRGSRLSAFTEAVAVLGAGLMAVVFVLLVTVALVVSLSVHTEVTWLVEAGLLAGIPLFLVTAMVLFSLAGKGTGPEKGSAGKGVATPSSRS
jgi:hypothetical protein